MGNGRNLGGYGGGGDYITEIEPSDEIIPGGFTTVVVLSSVGIGILDNKLGHRSLIHRFRLPSLARVHKLYLGLPLV